MTRHSSGYLYPARLGWSLSLLLLVFALAPQLYAAGEPDVEPAPSREETALQLKQAAQLYAERRFAEAAEIYKVASSAPGEDQAAWALELYGVCLEQQGEYESSIQVYETWLLRYPGNSGDIRVRQRMLALQTAALQPNTARRKAAGRSSDTALYGSSSLMYRGMRREVDGQDSETSISSLAGDVDLHLRARSGSLLWRGRVRGGYLSDQSDRDDSDARVSNLYVGVVHEPSGAELVLGRQRRTANGIYGYFDGASLSYPVTENIALNLVGGTSTTSSRESPDSDRRVYGAGAELSFPDTSLKLHLYGVEQTYDGITERRAVGGEITYFNEFSRYLLVIDYDTEFSEVNNLMFNGSWDAGANTNVALTMGYQRSPFLTASNAIIGEYDLDLGEYVERLEEGMDIYDAALEKTALSRYVSLVVNRRLADKHRLIGEVYHYELTDLPQYDGYFDAPDSDANTTLGLQYIWSDALFARDSLSMGVRYTDGDFSSNTSVYFDEKLRLNERANLVLRLRASRRSVDQSDQEALTLRPGLRLDWYFTPDFMLEAELGYEWLTQDFGPEEFEMQQGFLIMGLRKRFQ